MTGPERGMLGGIWITSLRHSSIPIVPFPELTYPRLGSGGRSAPILCNSFLGGSAPRLYALWLIGISFLAIPNLLLSASNLVSLALWRVPHSGYISPEAMAACLSSLNRLECLHLRFKSPQPRPDQPSPPPRTRVVLPVLTTLIFKGMTDYSEDFLARIDTPVLDQLFMTFFLDLGFDVPHLKEFIGRANRLKLPKEASVVFASRSIALQLDRHRHRQHRSSLDILDPRCDRIGWQVDSMALLCGQLSPFFSLIEQLDFIVYCPPSKPLGEDDIQSTQLLELFRPFTAVRSLHVSRSLVPLVATALQVLDGPRATEVLPKLRYLYYGRSAMPATVPEGMQSFVTARQLSGKP
ncbi:hypothetical protein BC826DRAFT_677912 [Russula brevipes]|nr:hypothetical protein BC826DRAFT_677912 [Russula brevipes]